MFVVCCVGSGLCDELALRGVLQGVCGSNYVCARNINIETAELSPCATKQNVFSFEIITEKGLHVL